MTGCHRIRQLRWQCRADTQRRALALRTRLLDEWAALLPALEQALDEVVGEAQLLHLPQLRVQLTEDDLDDLPRRLLAQLQELLQATAAQTLVQPDGSTPAPAARPHSVGGGASGRALDATRTATASAAGGRGVPGSDPAAARGGAVEEYRLELLHTYLERGELPWHALADEDLFEQLQQCLAAAQSWLPGWLARQSEVQVVWRWLRLLPASQWVTAIEACRAASPSATDTSWSLLLRLLRDDLLSVTTALQRGAWLTLALCRSRQPAARAAPRLAAALRLTSAQRRSWSAQLAAAGLSPERIAAILAPGLAGAEDADPVPLARGPQSMALDEERICRRLPLAGGVLLYPYLARLFDACGVRRRDGAVAPRHLGRAAALIVYACSGREAALDGELDCARLLLGLEPDAVDVPASDTLVVAGGLLSVDDRDEVERMLHALIGHWPRLRNTSVSGLRRAFLQRSALLSAQVNARESGWYLQFERLGHDVLLDFLPFPLSMVKLPWMNKPLHIRW